MRQARGSELPLTTTKPLCGAVGYVMTTDRPSGIRSIGTFTAAL
jgi:hypothetical protein